MLEMVDMAVTGYEPFMDVKLLVFPEFGHAAPVYKTSQDLLKISQLKFPTSTQNYMKKKQKSLAFIFKLLHFAEENKKWPEKSLIHV